FHSRQEKLIPTVASRWNSFSGRQFFSLCRRDRGLAFAYRKMATSKEVVPATIKHVVSTPNGTAIFLGVPNKIFVITVDHALGTAISMAMDGAKRERPLTHDLLTTAFGSFGIEVS